MGYYRVAKAIIAVNSEDGMSYLLSIKRDPGSSNEGKLEFPGGRMEAAETPREGLLRELSEEERTGTLAQLAETRATIYFPLLAGDAHHFLFPFHLSTEEFRELAHHPDESFGFELVAHHALAPDPRALTSKTNRILELSGLAVAR